ncbi:hypothetical protein JCM5350_004164 [Sporobolomyces pararoseus]
MSVIVLRVLLMIALETRILKPDNVRKHDVKDMSILVNILPLRRRSFPAPATTTKVQTILKKHSPMMLNTNDDSSAKNDNVNAKNNAVNA